MQTTTANNNTIGARITVIDALRGFSLIGICLIHAMQHFGAPGMAPHQTIFPWEGTLDEIFRWIINYLVFGKFFIIFSFLFGLSFFIQMDRASQKGIDFRPRFLWRLGLLLIIGFLHGLLVRVDILLIYALLGFPLVLMYKFPTKLLAGIALFLLLGGVNFIPAAYHSLQAPATEQVVAQPQIQRAARPVTTERVIPTVNETIRDNAWNGLQGKFRFQHASGRIYLTMGLFVLGLIVGRIRLFQRLEELRPALNKLALGCIPLLALLYILKAHIPSYPLYGETLGSWLIWTSTNVTNLLTAYLWVFIVITIYRSEKVQRAVRPLVSYGRMGLTNYIVQSVTGVCLFAGFGFDLGHLGVFFSVALCLLFTAIQIMFSHYWLTKFRYGPMEWIWRSGTYMKWQPILKVA